MSSFTYQNESNKQHKHAIADYFGKCTKYWKLVYDTNNNKTHSYTFHMMSRREAVLRFLDQYAQDRSLKVLDIGCGPGGVMEEVIKRGHRVVGMDISEKMVRDAKKISKHYVSGEAFCMTGDTEYLPFANNSFDAVLCVGVLQYLQGDRKAISEISRVVKPEGLVVITLPNMLRVNTLLDPYYYCIRGVSYVLHRLRQKFNCNNAALQSIDPHDFSANTTFINRRYWYNQLSRYIRSNCLREVARTALGFGPLTLLGKEVIAPPQSIRLSKLVEALSQKRWFAPLALFANRWVICLKRTTP